MKDAKLIKLQIGNQKEIEVPEGTTLLEVSRQVEKDHPSIIVAAKVNNRLRELEYVLHKDSDVEFLDLTNSDGIRIYQRSLAFVFIRASMEIFSGCKVTVEHSLSKGLYCELHYKRPIVEEDIVKIESRMQEIIEEDVLFIKDSIPIEDAKRIFNELGFDAKTKLLNYREKPEINIYSCGWLKDYFYGYMVPSTGFLKIFKLKYYDPGVIIQYPEKSNPTQIPDFQEQSKLASIFREAEKWGKIMDVGYVANLNERIENRSYDELVRVAEALHEKKIAQIADMITEKKKRIILIAGPSSSGKTTFAQRLAIQLRVNGLKPVSLSTDDYFVDREHTPKDEYGEYDFEALEAVDIELFNDHMSKLINGYEVEIPYFNFHTGLREYRGNIMKISEDHPIIIEGIHGLNERLTQDIPHDKKFKIYISALTQLNIDDHNRIPTTDSRLLRRIVRDSKYRGHSALNTLGRWNSVRRGEEKNIFPYQEDADVMFNSALTYELAVLKKYAEPLLNEIHKSAKEFSEAKRLLKFLSYFLSIDDETVIPQTSIIREFIGGSCFHNED
ncbi:nucleoside kinase [Geosporobacter ferrireducens]|uniref:AAA family ATPase n=1 Tax=Geosporobacter ferrireducens TaxID=1424294 RepID=A0A1D8GNB5_9FIRM|nr:nucleoside kinase [Geosporobacter ferrireducens]AOT72352.1 AAA family ATPase [Geosporobacter ferrireducens]